jgi:hypothetical protein
MESYLQVPLSVGMLGKEMQFCLNLTIELRLVRAGFVVGKVTLGQVSPVTIIPQMLRNHSAITDAI